MENNDKLILGIGAFVLLAILTRKMWMKKDGITIVAKQDTVASSSGDASANDTIGQEYTLLTDYKAINTKTMKDFDFKGADKNNTGTIFVKKTDKNGISINSQSAIKVFLAPSGTDEYVIPTTILKKLGGGASSSGKKNEQFAKFYKDIVTNPPKSEAEAIEKAKKYNLTKEDISALSSSEKDKFLMDAYNIK